MELEVTVGQVARLNNHGTGHDKYQPIWADVPYLALCLRQLRPGGPPGTASGPALPFLGDQKFKLAPVIPPQALVISSSVMSGPVVELLGLCNCMFPPLRKRV